jgi:branched-chain amino acid transport system ATP-binding protein
VSREHEPLLVVEGLAKRFGALHALDGLNLHVSPGEILGLVGPNGSGKTTAINAISGIFRPDAGQVRLAGRRIERLPTHRIVHLGINRTFQVPRCFGSLTARQNVEVALAHGGAREPREADALLDSVELLAHAARPAAELNSAQQKLLDLARALATSPRLLLVDELAAGLNPAEMERVAAKLKDLARAGMALLVVEHLMGFIDAITDRVIVMNAGREIFEGVLAEAVRDDKVVEVYLGGEHAA